MYNPDENDIDRLSREAAEHYRAPGTPAWDTLRQTLDKELPPEKEKKRRGFLFFFLMGIGLLVAGTGIWYGTRTHTIAPVISSPDKPADKKQQDSKDNLNTVAENPTTAKDKDTKELAANSAPNKNSNTQKTILASIHPEVNDKNETKKAANKSTLEKTKSAEKLIAGNHLLDAAPSAKHIATKSSVAASVVLVNQSTKNKLSSTNKSGSVNDNALPVSKSANLHNKPGKDQSALADLNGAINPKNKDAKKKAGKLATADQNVADVKANATNDIAAKNTGNDNTKDNIGAQKNNTQMPITVAEDATTNKIIAPKDAVAAKPDAVANKDSSKPAAAKVKSKSKNEKAILLWLTAGLDLSTVKFNYSSKVGYNFGFMGGYQFSKHWSVYTGLIYTKKNYKLNGSDYHPPKDYWTAQPGINLEKVDGYCRMWDVPLLARYTFNPSSKTSFFASAGLSSYFMKKQQYDYTYDTSGWIYTSSWSDTKSNNHYFSILDLSAGFERQMGKHMNWQVEPYARIPLGGVGFGAIMLSSFGINLTVQYKHPVKR